MKKFIVAIFFMLSACSDRSYLVRNIDDDNANKIISALSSHRINAYKEPDKNGGVIIEVDKENMAKAIEIISYNGLPSYRYGSLNASFKKSGMISSPLEEKARYVSALSDEIGRTLSYINGVVVARVHVVLPENGDFNTNISPASAGILIKYFANYNVEALIPQIKLLVASSLPGLDVDKVSVVMVPMKNLTDTNAQEDVFKKPSVLEDGSEKDLYANYETFTIAIGALGGALLFICILLFVWYIKGRRNAFTADKS